MKILVAEDDAMSLRMLQVFLQRAGHEVVTAANGIEALERMQAEDAPRLLLLDWEMPQMDGIEVCSQLRSVVTDLPPYIIFITAKDGLGDMVRGLDAGASDFVRKPFNREELSARIRVGERTLMLQAQLWEARQQMEHLAMHDTLTETYNRRAMLEAMERELSFARRSGHQLAIAILDIDRFKMINDTHGHHIGDAVLRSFAAVMKQCIRKSDLLARWGGEEFLVMAHVSGAPSLAKHPLFERIRAAVESDGVEIEAGQTLHYTVSIGVTYCDGRESIDTVLRRADDGLYAAKNGGRNRVVTLLPEAEAQLA